MLPVITDSNYSHIKNQTSIIFNDEFSSGPEIDRAKWRYEKLDGRNGQQHRVPYVPDSQPEKFGRRHSAFYDKYEAINTRVQSGKLRQRASIDRGSNIDPARNSAYSDPDGVGEESDGKINFGNMKLYGAWIDTFAYDQSAATNWDKRPLLPPAAPNLTFEPGSYFEILVDFSHMKMEGHRHSFWLMPATDGNGNIPAPSHPYDGNPTNGLEIDIYEHEFSKNSDNNDMLFMKCINGDTGADTTLNDFTSVSSARLLGNRRTDVVVSGINRNATTIGLLWTETELVWFVNGKAVVKDTDLIPKVPMYMILSRELNSGVKPKLEPGETAEPHEVYANGDPGDDPTIPKDPGLTAVNVGTKANLALINDDYVEVDYVRVWTIGEGSGPTGSTGSSGTLTQPAGLTGSVYSRTAAEIFWTANPSSDGAVEYQIKRNGSIIATKDARSHYDGDLSAGTRYTYELKAVKRDGSGNVVSQSPAAVYALTTPS